MKAVGLEEVNTYLFFRQNTVSQYIAIQPILELCLEEERQPGVWVSMIWWDQAGLELFQEGSDMDNDTYEEGGGEDNAVKTEVDDRRGGEG